MQTIGINRESFKGEKTDVWVRAVLRKDGIHLIGEGRDEKNNLLYTMYDDARGKTPIHWATIGAAIARVVGEIPKDLIETATAKNP